MDPRTFQKLAVRLAAGSSAADFRSAISRAYYGAFHVGGDALRSLGIHVGRGGAAHGEVQRSLEYSGDASVSSAGMKLRELHSLRIRADYQLSKTDIESSREAKAAVAHADDIIRTLDAALAGPERAQIQSAIAAWRRANGYP